MDKQFAVFDLDGTLADSMVCWAELAGEFLKKRGIHPVPEGIADEIKTMTMAEPVNISGGSPARESECALHLRRTDTLSATA